MATPSVLSKTKRRREHLFKRSQLLLLALGLLMVLTLLAPSSDMLLDSLTHPDPLSLRYLRLLHAVHPREAGVSLRLAQTLLTLGKLTETSALLASLPRTEPKLRQAILRIELQLHLAQYAQDPARAAREPKLVAGLLRELEALLEQPLSVQELTGLAASTLSIGQPGLASRIYLRLAQRDAIQRNKWLLAAAQQALASNQPAEAGAIYDQLVRSEKEPHNRRLYALAALRAYTGANVGAQALAVAQRYLKVFPHDPTLLEASARLALGNSQPEAATYYDELLRLANNPADRIRFAKLALVSLGNANQPDEAMRAAVRYLEMFPKNAELLKLSIRLALANQQQRLAQQWGRQLLAQHPTSSALLAHQIDIELAAGDPVAALALAQRLLEHRPDELRHHERVAQLALWSGQPALALAELTYLAMHSAEAKYLDQALKLAPQLYDMETLARLMELKAQRGRLTSSELASLVQLFEETAHPEELVRVLKAYLQSHPDHRAAWEALAEVHERRGDLPSALSTLNELSRDFGSSTKELVHRAELLWQLHRPSEAYVLLRDALDHGGIADTHELLTATELTSGPQRAPLQFIAPIRGRRRGEKQPHSQPAPKPKAAQDEAEERHSFLKLLAQLVWYSEPRPERLDEYRLLWKEGVLLRESADRYILLAETTGLIEEAITVSEQAFTRYDEPEFLIGAMYLASKYKRLDDMDRIVALSRRHEELFIGDKRYYLILAEYYTQRGDYDRAQRAYLRVVSLDPHSVAARADVLWLLIDHSDERARLRGRHNRHALMRYLTDWRQIGRSEPALWLPMATGWALLGRSRQAVSFFEREWTQRPTEHLWLLGYVSELDAVSRSSDARSVRRFALAQLRKDALGAAHLGANPAERASLNAYAELVREVYGPGKGSRWMSALLRAELDPEVRKGLLAVWRSDDENPAPSYWVQATHTLPSKNPWGRFPKSPKPGQQQVQPTLADASSAPDDTQEPAPAPLLVLSPDAAAGEDPVPQNSHLVTLSAGAQVINDLTILNTSISGQLARGNWALGGRVGVNQLLINWFDDPQTSPTEIELAAWGQWAHRLGRLELGVGANLRADGNLWSGWVNQSFKLWRDGVLQASLHLNELAIDSHWLRVYAARHRATVGLHTTFAGDGMLSVQADYYHYHTRTNEDIGQGVAFDVDLGYRIRRVRPLWTVRVTGSYSRNFYLADQTPEFGSASTFAGAPADTLPLQFATVGIGTRIEHRFPGIAPIGAGRWRYLADVWLGWMFPTNLVGFEVTTGVGLALPHKQEVSLKASVSNDRWLGPGVLNASLNLNYLFR